MQRLLFLSMMIIARALRPRAPWTMARRPQSNNIAAQQLVREQLERGEVFSVRVYTIGPLREFQRLCSKKRRGKVFLPTSTSSGEEQGKLDLLREEIRSLLGLKSINFELREYREDFAGEELAEIVDEAQLGLLLDSPPVCVGVTAREDSLPFRPQEVDLFAGMPDPAAADSWTVLSFYSFENVDNVESLAGELRKCWGPTKATGRVYVAKEGVNAQMTIPSNVLSFFMEITKGIPQLKNVFFNVDHEVESSPFKALHVREREKIVADGFETEHFKLSRPLDWNKSGREVPPEEWHELLSENPEDAILLDCRNTYETEVGRFDGAEPLNTTFFRDSWGILKERLSGVPKTTPVMTYCTGGIRCVKVNAFLEQELGFENTMRLEGGITNYAKFVEERTPNESLFKGVNYVFDERMARQITQDLVGECFTCGEHSNMIINCANPSCHVRFVQCANCQAADKYDNCCSLSCKSELNRLRKEASGAERTKSAAPTAASTLDFEEVVSAYVEKHSDAEPAYLTDLRRRVLDGEMASGAHMVSGVSQGRLLSLLGKLVRAKDALEIGTFVGYGTLCIAEGVEGRVVTLEKDERAAAIAEATFEKAPENLASKIEIRKGVAAESLERLAQEGAKFDLVYIDADKRSYSAYLESVVTLLRPGALILVDNTLFRGMVPLQESAQGRASKDDVEEDRFERIARALHEFNKAVAADERFSQTLLPLRDGLSLIRLKEGLS